MELTNENRIKEKCIILSGYGYFSILFVFITLAFSKTTQEAYDLVENPLMAMIGGTLAIAKDLINVDDDVVTKIKDERSSTSQGEKGGKLDSNEVEET